MIIGRIFVQRIDIEDSQPIEYPNVRHEKDLNLSQDCLTHEAHFATFHILV